MVIKNIHNYTIEEQQVCFVSAKYHIKLSCYRQLLLLAILLSTLGAYGQSARVGINTITPLAGLHIADSSVLFTGVTTAPAYSIPTPVSGPGIRLMWHPDRWAFRAGKAIGTEWNKDSIGVGSFAVGENVKARGANSISMGYNNSATGNYAVAIGSNNIASGVQSTALGASNHATVSGATTLGWNNTASGFRSTATGFLTLADGQESFSSGLSTKALGNSSFVGGVNNITNAFASFCIGRFSDTTSTSSEQVWVPTDPLFIIGNGNSISDRNNALTVLKNGNVGLNTKSPSYRFHVANNLAGEGGYAQGVMIENTNNTPGEVALSFRNKSIPGSRQWMTGINQAPPNLAFAYGSTFSVANTHMVIDTLGRVGMNTTSPQATLHVVRNLPSGGSFISSPLAVFESNNISYIHLSHENTDETGILSGNQVSLIRSGLVFVADSSIDLRAGGNGTDLKISTDGNVGIGIYTPTAKLHVNGTTKLGVNGTAITEIIKATVNQNVGSVPANGGTIAQNFTVTNAALTSAVSVSQDGALAAGLVIASARVSSANTVEVRFVNTSAGAIDPPAMDYHFTIIR